MAQVTYPKAFKVRDNILNSALPLKLVDAHRYSYASHGPGICVYVVADDDVTITMLADINGDEKIVMPMTVGIPFWGWIRNITDGGSPFAAGIAYVGLVNCEPEDVTVT